MVVVHDYSKNKKSSVHPDSSPRDQIDEDRAYTVGIWVFAGFVVVLIILFVLIAIGRTSQSEEVAGENVKNKEQVLGEKEETKKEPAKTELKETENTTKNEEVKDLERPLSQEETIAKQKQISGSKLHTVDSGESLYTIGEKYNTAWQKIAEVNNLAPPYNLSTGQKIIIPPKEG